MSEHAEHIRTLVSGLNAAIREAVKDGERVRVGTGKVTLDGETWPQVYAAVVYPVTGTEPDPDGPYIAHIERGFHPMDYGR